MQLYTGRDQLPENIKLKENEHDIFFRARSRVTDLVKKKEERKKRKELREPKEQMEEMEDTEKAEEMEDTEQTEEDEAMEWLHFLMILSLYIIGTECSCTYERFRVFL